MTHTDIDRRLALAIGYTADRVRVLKTPSVNFVQVLNIEWRCDGPMPFNGWQRFDHTDPAVIWPIAEKFDAFPYKLMRGEWLTCIPGGVYAQHKNPATATALAVIKYVESKA